MVRLDKRNHPAQALDGPGSPTLTFAGGAPGGLSMNKHRTALILFAVALGVVIAVASVTTLENVNTHKGSGDAIPGTTGLAKPHPQLDRAPGEPILKDR
jgi:hypothetical protein